MISTNSAKTYVFCNGFVVIMALIQYNALLTHYSFFIELLYVYAIFLIRNYILLYAIDVSTRHKIHINSAYDVIENYPNEFNINVFQSTGIDALSHCFITSYMSDQFVCFEFNRLIYFIPISFYYEVVLDLFHYLSHRFFEP